MKEILHNRLILERQSLVAGQELLKALSPAGVLNRGYAIVRSYGRVVESGQRVGVDDELDVELKDAVISVKTKGIKLK